MRFIGFVLICLSVALHAYSVSTLGRVFEMARMDTPPKLSIVIAPASSVWWVSLFALLLGTLGGMLYAFGPWFMRHRKERESS